MKKILVTLLFLIPILAQAQDVIVKKDGNTVLAKVTKVSENEVEYRKYNSSSERVYTISTSEIMVINYEDGDRDVFESSNQPEAKSNQEPSLIKVAVSPNNSDCVAFYNNQHFYVTKSARSKAATFGLFMMGVKKESVLSNDDLEVFFIGVGGNADWMKPGIAADQDFVVMVQNKTNSPIYIDLGNTFSVEDRGTYRVYFDTSTTTISNGKSNGVGVSLGGIANAVGIGGTLGMLAGSVAVSGQNSKMTTTTYAKSRVLVIPPRGIGALSDFEYNDNVILSSGESVMPPYTEVSRNPWENLHKHSRFPKGFVNANQIRVFDEATTPYSRDYTITYSRQEDFAAYSVVDFGVYLKEVVGVNYFRSNPADEFRYAGEAKRFWYSKYMSGGAPDRRMVGFYGFY